MSREPVHKSQMEQHSNRLTKETSPYLLQHAHNPVDWYPWGDEAFSRAKEEDKPVIVSIGYSSCHWCHVMERESFENDEVASIMNDYFINIKVDREERPDIDAIYMDAVHTLGVQGGWPLNVFLLPDGKPFYGGTYFPPNQWAHLLKEVHKAYNEKRQELVSSAEQITNYLKTSEVAKYELNKAKAEYSITDIETAYTVMQKKFDPKFGGREGAPKFPMPSNYLFLLRVYHLTNSPEALQHITLTLNRMAMGGIYDQIGGGFSRYSIDSEWLVPHFEKMLYDNGQLLSLYAEGYNLTGNQLYREVVEETVQWLEREMQDASGGFYSALDADSEGEEGKFYVWETGEIEAILDEEETRLFNKYYNLRSSGNWEHGKNILHKQLSDRAFANKHGLSEQELKKKVTDWKRILLQKRASRVRPALDDKVLTSWNGLVLKGLADAYRVMGNPSFLELAEKNARFLEKEMMDQGKLFHSWKSGKVSIHGYLEDYAFVIEGLISLYQATFKEHYLELSKVLLDEAIKSFYHKEEGMFYFASNEAGNLIARKKEIFDNVIPSSNSAMAANLYWLGVIYDDNSYKAISEEMLSRVKKIVLAEPGYCSNWGNLMTAKVSPTAEIVISGKDYLSFRKKIEEKYVPNKVLMGTETSSRLPLLQNREVNDGETMIFLCFNKTCRLPVREVEKALDLMQEK